MPDFIAARHQNPPTTPYFLTSQTPCTTSREIYFLELFGASEAPVPALGSKVCVCPSAQTTGPSSPCLHARVDDIQESDKISSRVARLPGLISSILPIIFRLSRGSKRSKRQGPLMTGCCWFVPSDTD